MSDQKSSSVLSAPVTRLTKSMADPNKAVLVEIACLGADNFKDAFYTVYDCKREVRFRLAVWAPSPGLPPTGIGLKLCSDGYPDGMLPGWGSPGAGSFLPRLERPGLERDARGRSQ